MKAIVLTNDFKCGGAERVASLVINGLSCNTANEVHVCIFENIINYNMDQARVKVHVLANPQRSHFVNSFLKIFNLSKVIKETKADVIYSFGPIMAGYVYFAKLISRTQIRVIDSERNDPRYEPVASWKKIVRNFCYNHADVLVCQTPMAADLLEKTYGVKTPKVIIPNPISPNLPKWNGVQSHEIITAARLTKQKNLPMLIDAFAMLHKEFSEFQLKIYGDGELKNFLSEYIEKKGLSNFVSLPGFSKDIHSVMKSAYMYVSSSDYEGISNSMLEALGIGLPCICTDCPVGGASMCIENGKNGLLTKVGDVNELFEAMKTLVKNPNLASKMSLASQSVNHGYNLERIIKKWIDLA